MHDLSESTKRAIDVAGAILTGTSAAIGALTLANVALIVTIVVGLLQGFWIAMRIRQAMRHGFTSGD